MEKSIIELDSNTINKIAAGEVIERPASVVKELVENSIDAGATEIQINIQEGGKNLIEVIDNGKGMNHEDVILAIKRHTTSKIKSADDLFDIQSLGFRGEALASIVSVAQVEIITKTKEEELGTRLLVKGGKIEEEEKISSGNGTRITVKNLFYNVPVRRKFLKTTSTELKHITERITKLALANPKISFSLIHNSNNLLLAPKGDLLSNITTIFGKNIAKAAIKIEKSQNGYFLDGYIVKPEFSRKSNDYIYIFVNHRPIRDNLITDAIIAGYGTTIAKGSYPIIFLNLNLPTDSIDVNIHPTKREVKFSEETTVFSLFEESIKNALEKSGLKIFERVKETKKKPLVVGKTLNQEIKNMKHTSKQKPQTNKRDIPSKKGYTINYVKKPSLSSFIDKEIYQKKTPAEQQKAKQKRQIRILGTIQQTYIIAETTEGLLLCDQHAAEEKINFVKFLNQIKREKVSQQKLLSPTIITLKPSEISVINQLKEHLEKLGFIIDRFGSTEIAIRAVPSIIGRIISPKIAVEIMDIIKNYKEEINKTITIDNIEFIKDLIALRACRKSIKAGDKISIMEAEKLIKNLLSQDDPWTCPHGRPTMIILNKEYIEELFGRDYR